jgi:sulfhydrogenase subunit gamma (sulfur reductase)
MSSVVSIGIEPQNSPYMPMAVKLVEAKPFTSKERYFRWLLPQDVETKAGQFMQVGLMGVGEAPISITSGPGRSREMEMCIRNVGDVTNALHQLPVGHTVWMRGPFGNGYDMARCEGQDILFVAGGLGLAPCRSFILGTLGQRSKYKDVTILYGSKTPADLLFKGDLEDWSARKDCKLIVTVDKKTDDSWHGHVGLITTLFRKITVDPTNTTVFIIGPPVMFKFAVLEVLALGIPENRIFCSLERRMKCGLGVCGHCQIREVYVCQEGPIFTYQRVKRLREGI